MARWLLVASLLLHAGCLRGSESDACVILEDCLCTDSVDSARIRCKSGNNRLGLTIDDKLSPEQCRVVLHQQGATCPDNDLQIVTPNPEPTAACVRDSDCAATCCTCGGSAAVSVQIRTCQDGRCLDPVVDCQQRCLQARRVRGDPCELLRRCRCAPLFDVPSLDVDGNGLADLVECTRRWEGLQPGQCRALAEFGDPVLLPDTACFDSSVLESTLLPELSCPDATEFVSEP